MNLVEKLKVSEMLLQSCESQLREAGDPDNLLLAFLRGQIQGLIKALEAEY